MLIMFIIKLIYPMAGLSNGTVRVGVGNGGGISKMFEF